MVLPPRLRRLPRAPSELHLPTIVWDPKFHLRRRTASAAAVAVPYLAMKEAVKPVDPAKALEVVLADFAEEGQECSVALK